MGGSDSYCAICGGPLGPVIWDDNLEELDEDEMLDRRIANPTTTAWLSRARVMGENAESGSMSKVFVSGPAEEDDAGFFNLQPSDDPNYPEALDSLRVYDREADHPLAIPFHEDCYTLLQARIGQASFDTGVLYHTFSNHLHGTVPQVLTLDWGVLADLQDQYFVTRRGTEHFLLCPTDIPSLHDKYSALPRIAAPGQFNEGVAKAQRPSTSSDAFARLPAELDFILLDDLSIRDVFALRQASVTMHNLELTNSFWKGRIARDMPWLYDIPSEEEANESVDWFAVYEDLYGASQMKHARTILALVNRRRIWTTMDQIMDTYFAELSRVRTSNTSEVLMDAQAGHMSLLHRHRSKQSQQSGVQRSLVGLLSNFADIVDARPRVRVYWNSAGSVSGFSISSMRTSTDALDSVIGDPTHFASFEDLLVPIDDWLSEITLVSKASLAKDLKTEERRFVGLTLSFALQDAIQLGTADGDRRVLRPSSGHVIVGLMGDCCAKGQISKLAILEQPRDRFPIDCARITYAAGSARNTQVEALLWRAEIPHQRLVLSEHQKGYWGFDVKLDLLPHEALVFAETVEEWKTLTSISGDMHMGGFIITYSDREPRTIGPRLTAMRSLSIDGANGERVVCVVAYVEHIVKGIRFITNRGRQLLVGLVGANRSEKRYSTSTLDGRELAGMYCSWLNRTIPDSRLETFGVLSREDHTYHPSTSMAGSADSHGFLWTPLPLPDSLTETGRLFGEWSYDWRDMHYSFPKPDSTVSWLNCSRLIAEVEVVTCHPQHQQPLNVVGIAFRYADGECERVAIGYTELTPEEPTIEEWRGWCQCRRGQSKPYPDDGPHIRSVRWKPQRIAGMQIWLDKDGALSGMQFVDCAGNLSPLWGFKSDNGTTGNIMFETNSGYAQAVGVKFFMNDNNRHVTYDDVVVVGLQAVIKR